MMLCSPNAPELAPAQARRAARRSAFTLLEVLVVMAIIVIIAGVSAFAMMSYLENAKVNEAKIQMSKIEQACNTYYLANSSTWPADLSVLVSTEDAPLIGGLKAITDPWGQQYNLAIVNDEVTGKERVRIICNSKLKPDGSQLAWPEA